MISTIELASTFIISHNNHFFFKLCFIVYAITVVPNFPSFSLSTQHPHSLRQSSNCCPCPWVMHVCSLVLYSLCCTLHPHDYSLTTNLYFLIPSPFSPILPTPFPCGNHQNILCLCDSVSVLFTLFFRFHY